jgi:hypothetical protein
MGHSETLSALKSLRLIHKRLRRNRLLITRTKLLSGGKSECFSHEISIFRRNIFVSIFKFYDFSRKMFTPMDHANVFLASGFRLNSMKTLFLRWTSF